MASDVASKGGDLFVAAYYKYYDSQRHILHKLYMDAAPILWNGNAFNGIAAFREFYLQLPPTTHEFQSVDVQPLLAGDSNILVSVTGSVKIGDQQHSRTFSQVFVLMPVLDGDGKKIYQVGSDTFRFT